MDVEALVADARQRRPQPMSPRERLYAGVSATAFLGVVALLSGILPHDAPDNGWVLVIPVLLYALGTRCLFEVSAGFAVPTQIVLIPIIFMVPLPLAPLLVALGYLLGRLPDFLLKRAHVDRWIHCFGHAWAVVPPVLIIGLFAPGPPSVEHIGVYAVAVAGQFVVGVGEAVLGDRFLTGTPVRENLSSAVWSFWITLLLTPLGFMLAGVAVDQPLMLLSVAPLYWLLHAFSQERKERLDAALELSQTYRGTVMVLADVVEADDNYTASHCRSVVELARPSATRWASTWPSCRSSRSGRCSTTSARSRSPSEILNKPAHLTEEEFELMKTHTIEGQALLERVGGQLARVGELVRSCHERWDGRGYPDGLAGEEIPMAARIVFCCDAYSR